MPASTKENGHHQSVPNLHPQMEDQDASGLLRRSTVKAFVNAVVPDAVMICWMCKAEVLFTEVSRVDAFRDPLTSKRS